MLCLLSEVKKLTAEQKEAVKNLTSSSQLDVKDPGFLWFRLFVLKVF